MVQGYYFSKPLTIDGFEKWEGYNAEAESIQIMQQCRNLFRFRTAFCVTRI